ncbi:family 20 glycosylhydrolase [Aliikangiella coralliicola]|uniref:beta-N-acetylhexosaminidase n=1 Tax=Aliikangiella coralliicola TaxID=2592383 RepID=A0A545UHI6_9GAMM|nr:family 20 glycosylhydrolase [Aliikangiella coralliicola]TQV88918.1 family 20 glycosylhydrolase [Aliikangiella coralliicola]
MPKVSVNTALKLFKKLLIKRDQLKKIHTVTYFRSIRKVTFLIVFFIAGCGADESSQTDKNNNAKSPGIEQKNHEPVNKSKELLAHSRLTPKANNVVAKDSEKELQLQQFAKHLKLNYQVITNRPSKDCDKSVFDGLCFRAAISLQLEHLVTLTDWRIFFSHMSPIQKDYSEAFNIVHVNGDLHYIEPTKKFTTWSIGKAEKIEFIAGVWHISEYDSPPNFYVVVDGLKPAIIDSTRSVIDPETLLETLPHVTPFTEQDSQFKRTSKDSSVWATASQLFEVNKSIEQKPLDVSARIIPKPKSVQLLSKQDTLNISQGIQLTPNEFNIDKNSVAVERLRRLGIPLSNTEGKILKFVKSKSKFGKEGYQLKTTQAGIEISADNEIGAFYGLQSLAALYKPGDLNLPLIKVVDEPRYAFRGLLLDVARNFRSKEFVIKLLDQMSAYKLNKLHFHLGDDEGWRMEIPGLPELTQVGATRCHDLSESGCLLPQLGSGPATSNGANGFYSIDEYQAILKAAQERNIEVIPSFDMPGHSRAAVVSMQARYRNFQLQGKLELAEEYLLTDLNDQSKYSSIQYYSDNTLNICRKSTYRFVEKVIDEVVKIHNRVGVPLTTYHIGADETPGAWKESPMCHQFMQEHDIQPEELGSHFIKTISQFLDSRNIRVAGWSDGMAEVKAGEMPSSVQVNAWRPLFWDGHKVAHSMANQNWDVVVSIPDALYFDFAYEADPKERGYYWGSRSTNTRQVFELMPDNLPIHAEIWTDRENNPMVLDDRFGAKQNPQSDYKPLLQDKAYLGIQGHLWSEMVRSDDIAEYLLFPRLLALAERAWHKAEWEPVYNYQGAVYSQQSQYFTEQHRYKRKHDWRMFANTIAQKEMAKLESLGWLFRIPTVGAEYDGKLLKLNSAFPGLSLQFSVDNNAWREYDIHSKGVPLSNAREIKVRAKSPNGKRYGRTLTMKVE